MLSNEEKHMLKGLERALNSHLERIEEIEKEAALVKTFDDRIKRLEGFHI